MKSAWATFKRFWTAEEVPRWFGLSLVLVYLTGLGAVGHFSTAKTREEARGYLEQSGRYAVQSLARRLCVVRSSPNGHGTVDPAVAQRLQRELAEFSAHIPTRSIRVLDGNRLIVASSDVREIGSPADQGADGSAAPRALESHPVPVEGQDEPDRLYRSPIGQCRRAGIDTPPTSTAQAAAQPPDGHGTTSAVDFYVEAQLLPESRTTSQHAARADMLTVVLVALGVLFGLYRCLRAQLRSVSRIAQRLQTHGERIEEDLASLRIGDTMDSVANSWNELVDLAQRLTEAVARTEANEELSRVLAQSGGGALAQALNALPDGIIFISNDGQFEYLNATACRLLGFNGEEIKTHTVRDVQAEGMARDVIELLRSAYGADDAFEARTELVEVEEDGSGSCYRVWIIPLNRPHQHGECIVVLRDVSQQVRSERAREDFVTQVTHELRTPLTNIRAYAETLSSGMFDDPKVITDCYNVITKETRRLSRLIEDILSVSQLEVGSIELHIDEVDLKSLLGDGVRDVRGLADEKNIDIQLLLPAKMEPIRGDRDKIAVVVNNLLGNAIKYTPQDGNVIVGCQYTGESVILTFKDNGIGIDAADQGRVFEKFQRANDATVQNEPGTGIGLFTAREIVRRHGGDIDLISQKGEGSTFLVRLPHSGSRASALSLTEEVTHSGQNPGG